MTSAFKHGRLAVVLMLFAFLASCTQSGTAVSSYNGKIGRSASLSEDARKAKIQASRQRAKKKKAERRAAFLEKRRAGRKSAKTNSRKKRFKKTKWFTKKKLKKTAKRAKKRATKNTVKKRVRNAKVRKRKTVKIKRVSAAFVGGRSKGIRKSAPWNCVPPRLKKVISQVSRKFGRVTINSTHRSRGYNRRVGGKRRSYHLRCAAVDFRVHGSTRGLTRWLARHPSVGGYKRYPSGFYHIDTGPKRTW